MNKIIALIALTALGLNAEYTTEKAVGLGKKIVAETLVDIASSGRMNIDYDAETVTYQELAASLSAEDITTIMQQWQNYTLNTSNIEIVKTFVKDIQYLCVELNDASDNYDLMRLYNQLLPFVAQNRTAALIIIKTYVLNDTIPCDISPFVFDALMHDTDGSLITAALVSSRYPGSGSDALAKFAQTV
jgi:hypothetical protein